MGSRIVPLSTDDATEFTQGKAITKNKMRTVARTIRKGMDRYQLRREALKKVLREHGMLPDESLIKLPLLELWELRARAATPRKQLSLPELGRVLLHINQKRGYKHAKADAIVSPVKGQVFWEFQGDGEAAPAVEPFIGKEYKEGEKFCYILAPWGEFVEIPAALGGKLVEINAKQGSKINKGDVIAYIQRDEK